MFFGNRRPRILTARQHDSSRLPAPGRATGSQDPHDDRPGGNGAARPSRSSRRPLTALIWRAPTPSAGAGYSVADVADLTGNNSYDSLVIGAPGVTVADELSAAAYPAPSTWFSARRTRSPPRI